MPLNKPLTSWASFKTGLLKRFGPSLYQDILGELVKLQQNSIVQDFYTKFEKLSNQIIGISSTFL